MSIVNEPSSSLRQSLADGEVTHPDKEARQITAKTRLDNAFIGFVFCCEFNDLISPFLYL
jgi:hypothetical protein